MRPRFFAAENLLGKRVIQEPKVVHRVAADQKRGANSFHRPMRGGIGVAGVGIVAPAPRLGNNVHRVIGHRKAIA